MLLINVVSNSMAAPADAESRELLNRLERRGLVRLGAGNEWVMRRELLLRKQFSGLPKYQESIETIERQLAERIQQNRQLWDVRRQLQNQLNQLSKSRSPDEQKRRQLQQQIAALETQAAEPPKLGAMPDVQSRLIELTNNRTGLMLSILWIRATEAALADEYARLAADPDLAATLLHLGDANRLAAPKTYNREIKQLADFEPLVFNGSLPLYLQSGRLRVGAVINEQLPVTFSWLDSSQPTIITASVAESAGVTIPSDSQHVEIKLDGRKFHVPEVTIPNVRFGQYLLQDVKTYVLPPEGEDLACQIGPAAFPGYQVNAEPKWLRLTVKPTE
jgi:hypothetical protein